MRTGKINNNAFQGETDFAGGGSAAGRGAKKDKKEKKAKRKARGVISSSRRGGYLGVLSGHTISSPAFPCLVSIIHSFF